MSTIDRIALANAKAKGRRPYFFEHPEAERVLNITMAVMQELAVTRERLDTLERLLESKGVLARAEIEAYAPDRPAAQQRADAHQELIGRCLRILQQEVEALHDAPQAAATADELASS